MGGVKPIVMKFAVLLVALLAAASMGGCLNERTARSGRAELRQIPDNKPVDTADTLWNPSELQGGARGELDPLDQKVSDNPVQQAGTAFPPTAKPAEG